MAGWVYKRYKEAAGVINFAFSAVAEKVIFDSEWFDAEGCKLWLMTMQVGCRLASWGPRTLEVPFTLCAKESLSLSLSL